MTSFRRRLLKRTIDRTREAQWSAQSLQASTLEELLPQITLNATRLLKCPVCVLLLLKKDHLVVASQSGLDAEAAANHPIPIAGSFSGRLILRGQPLLIGDVSGYQSPSQKQLEPYYAGALACTPLVFNQKIIGLMNICRPASEASLSRDDLTLLISYGGQAAFAITSQRLVEKRTAQLQRVQEDLVRANRRLQEDIDRRRRMGKALLKERDKLLKALAQVKTLRGLLPICASCKKIRDDKGYWKQIESYIQEHSEANFSHSICPSCAQKLYPGLDFPKS